MTPDSGSTNNHWSGRLFVVEVQETIGVDVPDTVLDSIVLRGLPHMVATSGWERELTRD